MNIIESIIYDKVKNNPVLKQKIVNLYQGALSVVPQKKIQTALPLVDRKGYFYGFHDKSPFSPDGSLLLAHRVTSKYGEKKPEDAIELGFFQGDDWKLYQSVGTTTGWNWQLGSMLQWHGASNNLLVYNAMDKGRHVSVVKSLDGRTQAQYQWPVVHVSPDQVYACSYNFKRAEKAMPGYGIITTDESMLLDMNTDCFRIFTCKDGQSVYELSLAEAASIRPHPSMDGAFHFFHHALFNPASKRVFFLHRWLDKNERRWTRMFSVGVDGTDLYLFPMDEMVSHITWASNTEVFSYLRYPGLGDGYYLVEDQTGKCIPHFGELLNSDGHPTMDQARGLVLTDTYPDRFRNQFLVLCNLENGNRTDLLRTHLPSKFKGMLQVDLHPRLHPNRFIACVDSAHNGAHSLMTIDFSKLMV